VTTDLFFYRSRVMHHAFALIFKTAKLIRADEQPWRLHFQAFFQLDMIASGRRTETRPSRGFNLWLPHHLAFFDNEIAVPVQMQYRHTIVIYVHCQRTSQKRWCSVNVRCAHSCASRPVLELPYGIFWLSQMTHKLS
jgi:hypothetical protein